MKKIIFVFLIIFCSFFAININVHAYNMNDKICEYKFPSASEYKIYILNFADDGKHVKGIAYTQDRNKTNNEAPKYWSSISSWYSQNKKCPYVVYQETSTGIVYSVYSSKQDAQENMGKLPGKIVLMASGTDTTGSGDTTCEDRLAEFNNNSILAEAKKIICKKSNIGMTQKLSSKCLSSSGPAKDEFCNKYTFDYCIYARDGDAAFNNEVTKYVNTKTSEGDINVVGKVNRTTFSTEYYGDDLENGILSTFTIGDFYKCSEPIKTTDPSTLPVAPTSPTVDLSSTCKDAFSLNKTSTSDWKYKGSTYKGTDSGVQTCNYVQCKTMSACKYDAAVGYWLCDSYEFTGDVNKCKNGEDVPSDPTPTPPKKVTDANGTCPIGKETAKDIKGAWKIMKIVIPLLALALTILDAIRTLTKGDVASEMNKFIKTFVKRIFLVILLFFINALITLVLDLLLPATYCDMVTITEGNGVEST